MRIVHLASACLLLLAASCSQSKEVEDAKYAPFATAEEKIEAVKALYEAHGWKLRTDVPADSMRAHLLSVDYEAFKQELAEFDSLVIGDYHPVSDEVRDSILRLGEELEKAGRIRAAD